jgi:uncharacterized protein (DUF885 family)
MRIVLSVLVLSLLGACASAPVQQSAAPTPEQIAAETQRINEWFEQKFEEQLQFSPITLTFLGRKELYDRLDDMSVAAADEQLAWQKASVEEMQARFRYERLSAEGQRSWDVWKRQYERAAAGVPFRVNNYVFQQMSGQQSFLPTFLINFHRVDAEADMLAWIARVGEVQRALEQLIVRAQDGLDAGVRPPRFAYEGVLEQSRKIISGAPFTAGADASIWADAQAKVDALIGSGAISAERGAALKSQARAALVGRFQPSSRPTFRTPRSTPPASAPSPMARPTTTTASR